jgi:hypothetical protein
MATLRGVKTTAPFASLIELFYRKGVEAVQLNLANTSLR